MIQISLETDDDDKIYTTIKKCVREMKSVLVEGTNDKSNEANNTFYGDNRESRNEQFYRDRSTSRRRYLDQFHENKDKNNRNYQRSLSRQRNNSQRRSRSNGRRPWKSPSRDKSQNKDWKSPERKIYFCDKGEIFLSDNNLKTESVNMAIIDCGCG